MQPQNAYSPSNELGGRATACLRNRARDAPRLVPLEFPQKPRERLLRIPWSLAPSSLCISSLGPSWSSLPTLSLTEALVPGCGVGEGCGDRSAGTYSSVHQPQGSGHTTPAPGPSWALAGGSAASSGGARYHRTWGSPSGSSPGSPVLPSPERPTPPGTCTQRGTGIRTLQHPTSAHP